MGLYNQILHKRLRPLLIDNCLFLLCLREYPLPCRLEGRFPEVGPTEFVSIIRLVALILIQIVSARESVFHALCSHLGV